MIEEILNKIYTRDLLSSEELHELTEWVCNKDNEIERLNNIINEIKECLSKNRVYITGERNLAFELDDILKGVDKEWVKITQWENIGKM